MTWLLSPMVLRVAAAAALLAALAWAYNSWANRQREIGREEVRIEWQADKMARAEQNRLLMMSVDKASDTLQKAVSEERRALHARNRSIDLERDELIRRLRNRPDRPEPTDSGSGVPTVAGSGPTASGCTGAGLYKPDGEFLAGLAADASRLQTALRSCQAAYKRAQDAVNK